MQVIRVHQACSPSIGHGETIAARSLLGSMSKLFVPLVLPHRAVQSVCVTSQRSRVGLVSLSETGGPGEERQHTTSMSCNELNRLQLDSKGHEKIASSHPSSPVAQSIEESMHACMHPSIHHSRPFQAYPARNARVFPSQPSR
jgi:hypothetical protein